MIFEKVVVLEIKNIPLTLKNTEEVTCSVSDKFSYMFTLSLPTTHCASDNTDLPSNKNISKTVTFSCTFTTKVLKEYLIKFLSIPR